MRFVNTNPEPGKGKYIATYETNWEDVSKAWMALQGDATKMREQERISPHL